MTRAQEPEDEFLRPGRYIDSGHPAIAAFAARVTRGATAATDKAVKLYYAVRDEILYDPYVRFDELDAYRASAVLTCGRGYCVGKAALLAASARAQGIPARIAFADVRNHLATPHLLAAHRQRRLHLPRHRGAPPRWTWIKATPAFNLSLCEKFHIKPLEFDGLSDAILHPYDPTGAATWSISPSTAPSPTCRPRRSGRPCAKPTRASTPARPAPAAISRARPRPSAESGAQEALASPGALC